MTPHKVTAEFWDHATLWTEDDAMAGHTTDGGRVYGITRTRYAECDRYGCKPVVVLDPEGSVVNRLIPLLGTAYRGSCDQMRTALRSLLSPPRPVEPTGLGAVVEDKHGHLWTNTGSAMPNNWMRSDDWGAENWKSIDAVRVLSEGVPA